MRVSLKGSGNLGTHFGTSLVQWGAANDQKTASAKTLQNLKLINVFRAELILKRLESPGESRDKRKKQEGLRRD